MKSKALKEFLEIKKSNSSNMRKLLQVVYGKMSKQGCGCFIRDYGVAYYSAEDNTFDPIGIILGKNIVNRYYGPINNIEQRPLVKSIAKRFKINMHYDSEVYRFTKFLADIQLAHDIAFDSYRENGKNSNRQNMHIFVTALGEIFIK